MKSETWTLSFLPALDDLEYGGELVAHDWEPAITDESGMFRGAVRHYEAGSYLKTYLEMKICRYGLFVRYQFSYGHKTYGTSRPLAVDCSGSCHRGNAPEFMADGIRNELWYRLVDDGNLDNEGRKAIIKLYDSKIKVQVTRDLRGLDNGKI
jgi:hypothetical protein